MTFSGRTTTHPHLAALSTQGTNWFSINVKGDPPPTKLSTQGTKRFLVYFWGTTLFLMKILLLWKWFFFYFTVLLATDASISIGHTLFFMCFYIVLIFKSEKNISRLPGTFLLHFFTYLKISRCAFLSAFFCDKRITWCHLFYSIFLIHHFIKRNSNKNWLFQ